MPQVLNTRWATGNSGWKIPGRGIWSKDTPLSWGTRPHLSHTRSKFRAKTVTAGDQNLKLLLVTLEKMVSNRCNTASTVWFYFIHTFRLELHVNTQRLSQHMSLLFLLFLLSLTLNVLCHRIQPCLQSSFGIVCGKMCQVKFFPFLPYAHFSFAPVQVCSCDFSSPLKKVAEEKLLC